MKRQVAWVEVPSRNFERAVDFYNIVFWINLNKHQFKDERIACFENNEGAIIYSPEFSPSKNGVIISLSVPDSIEETISRVLENHGKVVQTKKTILRQEGGSFAIIQDSEGNRIGLFNER